MKQALIMFVALSFAISCSKGGGGGGGGGGGSTTGGGAGGSSGGGGGGGTMDIVLSRANLEYVEHLPGYAPAISSYSVAAPAIAGNTPVGSGSVPSLGGVPTPSTGGTGSAAVNPATVPTDFPGYSAASPVVEGSFATNIVSCTLEDVMVRPCSIAGMTFTAPVAVADLAGLTTLDLNIDGDYLAVPVKKYEIQKIGKTCAAGTNAYSALYKTSTHAYYLANVGSGASCYQKIVKITNAGVITLVSNISGSMTTSDTINTDARTWTEFNGEVYFAATNANGGGNKVFKISASDVVSQVADTRNDQTANDGSVIFVHFNGELYFAANNSNGVSKLFKVNTAGVVTQVSNTKNDNTLSDSVTPFGVFNNELYFRAWNANGNYDKLFKVDTSGVVTQALDAINNQNASDDYVHHFFKVANNKLYIVAQGPDGFRKLTSIDTVGTVSRISNYNPGAHDEVGSSVVHNNEIYFIGYLGGFNGKLFKVDASGSLIQLTDFNPGADDSIGNLTPSSSVGTDFYFTASDGSIKKLYKAEPDADVIQVSNTSGSNGTTDGSGILASQGTNIWLKSVNSAGFEKLFRYNTATNDMAEMSNFNNAQPDYIQSVTMIGSTPVVVYGDMGTMSMETAILKEIP